MTDMGMNLNWLRMPVRSPGLVRAALIEMSQDNSIKDSSLRATLDAVSKASDAEVAKVHLFVDLRAFLHLRRAQFDANWENAALSYLIARRAPYPMLKSLFRTLTRPRAQQLREGLGVPPAPTRITHIPTARLNELYEAWLVVSQDYAHPVERWIAIAEQFPEFPLSSLYSAIELEQQAST